MRGDAYFLDMRNGVANEEQKPAETKPAPATPPNG
jgi:hypothetical protein